MGNVVHIRLLMLPIKKGPLELHIRHLPGGLFTDFVFGAKDPALKEKDILRFEGPLGSFFLREDSKKPIIFVAAGTGFAPIKSIVEQMQLKKIHRLFISVLGWTSPE